MDSRDAASPPQPARLRASPLSRRLPLKGGVITASHKASVIPRRSSHPSIPPQRPFKHSRITPPLRGSRRSPSRMAKASAVGGSHKASRRRDLVRRRGCAPANLQAKASAERASHKQRRTARSCAPSRSGTSQVKGEGQCGGGPTPHPQVQRRVPLPTRKRGLENPDPFQERRRRANRRIQAVAFSFLPPRPFTSIFFGRAAGARGAVISSTPLWKEAEILSRSVPLGKSRVCSYLP